MTFDAAVRIVLDLEGGFVNDPQDAGGATRFGISQAAFPGVDVKGLTLDAAREIYRRYYWSHYHCDELPWPLALVLFDSVVQFSPTRPVSWMQAAVGTVVDGRMGSVTVEAARSCVDPVTAACEMMVARGEYRTTRPNYEHFGKGWRRRDMVVLCEASRSR